MLPKTGQLQRAAKLGQAHWRLSITSESRLDDLRVVLGWKVSRNFVIYPSASFCSATNMVKAYLRYELGKSFGVVTSGTALDSESSGRLVITAVHENIALWNLRQGTQVRICQHRSTCLSALNSEQMREI